MAEHAEHKDRENVTIPELAAITKTKASFLYEMSRRNQIPGMFRISKFVRIHLPSFYAATLVKENR